VNKLLIIVLFLMPVLLYAQDKGTIQKMQDYARSVESESGALKSLESRGDKKGLAHSYGNLGNLYLEIAKLPFESVQQYGSVSTDKKVNLNKSIEYSNKSAELSEEVGDGEQLKSAYKTLYAAQKMAGNVGDASSTYGKILALKHSILNPKKAKEIQRKELEYEYGKREDSIRHEKELAEERVKQQTQILAQQQQQLQASNQTLTAAQKEKENVSLALQKTQSDLSLEKSNSEEKTKELTQAEAQAALQAANLQLQQSALQLQQSKLQLQQNELQMKDKALEERRKERYLYIIGIFVLLAFSLLVYRNYKVQKKSNLAVLTEKKRSEELLLNILPAEVAGELMQKGFADAKHFYDVTVLFTDFVNFTTVAETMSPQQLVGELHVCFKAFDVILSKYHIEKIKTVGDAYLAVSGLPGSNPNHATDIAAAAIEIRDFMAARKKDLGSGSFGIRIGINSGNVVAGIVGLRKFSYDIWGDTVNIAARMEQNSETGKINISEATYQLVKEKFACVYRGKVEAKNKGGIDMYYLEHSV
jgi:adenylate cyclase